VQSKGICKGKKLVAGERGKGGKVEESSVRTEKCPVLRGELYRKT